MWRILTHIVNCLKTFLIHGYVPNFLLVCSLVPIVKDSYGDISSSTNYRAVAIGSIVLKIFDWVLLLLQGNKLSTDELQVGFQTMSSTTMCTWTLSTVVEHFNSRGRTVFGTAMDCSKAFDVCSWVYLFDELLEKGISPIFLRLLIYMYQNQSCDVNWSGSHSQKFPVYNGVRQGAISSPIFFSIYLDKLIKRLRSMKIGCSIAGQFYEFLVYADDMFLFCPSREGLQAMITECELFTKETGLSFSVIPVVEKFKTMIPRFPKLF